MQNSHSSISSKTPLWSINTVFWFAAHKQGMFQSAVSSIAHTPPYTRPSFHALPPRLTPMYTCTGSSGAVKRKMRCMRDLKQVTGENLESVFFETHDLGKVFAWRAPLATRLMGNKCKNIDAMSTVRGRVSPLTVSEVAQ